VKANGTLEVGQRFAFASWNTIEVPVEVVVQNDHTGEVLTLTPGETYRWPGPGISFTVVEVRK
jgi:hypothetical protein